MSARGGAWLRGGRMHPGRPAVRPGDGGASGRVRRRWCRTGHSARLRAPGSARPGTRVRRRARAHRPPGPLPGGRVRRGLPYGPPRGGPAHPRRGRARTVSVPAHAAGRIGMRAGGAVTAESRRRPPSPCRSRARSEVGRVRTCPPGWSVSRSHGSGWRWPGRRRRRWPHGCGGRSGGCRRRAAHERPGCRTGMGVLPPARRAIGPCLSAGAVRRRPCRGCRRVRRARTASASARWAGRSAATAAGSGRPASALRQPAAP
jgi:hypothetical protein